MEIESDYLTPNYQIKRTEENRPFIGKINYIYFVEFEDNIRGTVFKTKNEKPYFEDKGRTLHYYVNLDSCIGALHYYLTTGKIYNKGWILSY